MHPLRYTVVISRALEVNSKRGEAGLFLSYFLVERRCFIEFLQEERRNFDKIHRTVMTALASYAAKGALEVEAPLFSKSSGLQTFRKVVSFRR